MWLQPFLLCHEIYFEIRIIKITNVLISKRLNKSVDLRTLEKELGNVEQLMIQLLNQPTRSAENANNDNQHNLQNILAEINSTFEKFGL